jgi:hypothetical protein
MKNSEHTGLPLIIFLILAGMVLGTSSCGAPAMAETTLTQTNTLKNPPTLFPPER